MSIHSQFSEVDKLKTEAEMVEKLKKMSSNKHIKEILSLAFDENIVWLLPDTDPPYKPSTDKKDKLESRLLQEMRSMPIFLNYGKYVNMKQSKREQIFVDILQTISPDDAILLLSIKNKKLPFDNLTREVVEKAFPLLAEKWKKRA